MGSVLSEVSRNVQADQELLNSWLSELTQNNPALICITSLRS
jgi:hypothetical protein